MKSLLMKATLVGLVTLNGSSVFAEPTGVNCTDFTGKWAGTCRTSEGKEYAREMSIRQNNCHAFNETDMYGSQESHLIGEKVEAHKEFVKNGAYGVEKVYPFEKVTYFVDWDADVSKLKGTKSKTMLKTREGGEGTLTIADVFERSLADSKLIEHTSTTIIEEGSTAGTVQEDCIYEQKTTNRQ